MFRYRGQHIVIPRVASSNTHTLETIIVIYIKPIGQVSYVSASYGGSASDRHRRDTPLLKDVFSIMADMRIMAEYYSLDASKRINVNTPTIKGC